MATDARVSRWRGAGNHRPPSKVASRAARVLGLQPETVHALIHGRANVAKRFAAILEAAVSLGDDRMVCRLMAPVDAALQVDRPDLSPDLIRAAQEADAAEEVAETTYLANPTPEHQREWLRKLAEQRFHCHRLELALARAELTSQ